MMTVLAAYALLVGFAIAIRRRSAASTWTSLWVVLLGAVLCAILWVLTSAVHLSILGLSLLLAVPGPLRPRPRLGSPPFLDGHAAVVLAGLSTMAVVVFIWGSLSQVPPSHDEAAYVLQARIFASGRWVAPERPLAEFFEQMHVFVTPFLASKYPPGHSLVLVPGIWLGWPGLVPVLLNGFAGALVFAHARRLAGAAVGLLTWLIWLTASGTVPYRVSYLSETTTTVLWLLALWALREWLDKGGRRWVVLLGFCLGWGAITRPMTMFCLSIPIAALFLRKVWIRRDWKDLAIAVAVGTACLAILPIWSARTTGDWRKSPYRYYSTVYYPYEWTGFGVRPEPPLRPVPASMEPFERQFKRIHAEHTVRALPDTIFRRLHAIAMNQWAGREPLGLVAILGALEFDAAAVFAVVSALSLFIGYLNFAHSPGWSPYYVEIQTVLSFATALGLCGVVASLLSLRSSRGETQGGPLDRRSVVPLIILAAVLVASALVDLPDARAARRAESEYQASFHERVRRLPAERSIVFVRYGPAHDVHRSLIVNEPDLASARAWIVHDRGERNAELARRDPGRRLYLYDEARRSFVELAPPR